MEDKNLLVEYTRGTITCDFSEIEEELRLQMTAYADLEVTEDNIPERKKDVATLRKIKTAVEDKRKEIKKEYSKPLAEFEAKVKQVTGIIDEQIVRINSGLDEFDKKRIQEKREHIKELYEKEAGEYAEFLPLEIIRSSRWDNKTCTDNEIISEIQTAKLKVRADIEAIKALGSDIEEKLIITYKENGNSLAAIQQNNAYLEGKKAGEKVAPTACQPAEPVKVWDAMNEPVWTIRITGLDAIDKAKGLLAFNGIEYQEV